MRKLEGIAIVAFAIVTGVSVHGAVVFDRTWNGADLVNDPLVARTAHFSNRSLTIVNTSLHVGPGITDNEKLLEWALVSEQTLKSYTTVIITVNARFTRLTLDYDPGFQVNCGELGYMGLSFCDNFGGTLWLDRFRDANADNIADVGSTLSEVIVAAPGFPAIGAAFDLKAVFTITKNEAGERTTEAYGTMNGKEASRSITAVNLTPGALLSFWANSPEEEYQIDSLRVQLDVRSDCNGNGTLDEFEVDTDGDGLIDDCDSCPLDAQNDQDHDGVCGDLDQCPNTIPGVSVDANGCPPPISGDFDRDGDVDQSDYAVFQRCFSGPSVPADPNCASLPITQ
jgi:hypothetical protein